MQKKEYSDLQRLTISGLKEAIAYWVKRAMKLKNSLEIAENELEYLRKDLAFVEKINFNDLEPEEYQIALDRIFEISSKLQKHTDRYGKTQYKLRRY